MQRHTPGDVTANMPMRVLSLEQQMSQRASGKHGVTDCSWLISLGSTGSANILIDNQNRIPVVKFPVGEDCLSAVNLEEADLLPGIQQQQHLRQLQELLLWRVKAQ